MFRRFASLVFALLSGFVATAAFAGPDWYLIEHGRQLKRAALASEAPQAAAVQPVSYGPRAQPVAANRSAVQAPAVAVPTRLACGQATAVKGC
ncbi:hypothetical protein [Zoogloea sp. LCSB751]|uniref:hypothetical protein n=1 Tax=Zoogloea sp. LCSB751 TaxID=1965277 RepID=UPI0009A5428F|nr:hypothetical protein [Zoogloea sp. LCSB751]